jgi:NNP family nitrate/nitrite transporter-like MFS transporter
LKLRDFHRAGHTPTLLAAFLYFDVSFMVWVILGPLGPFLGDSLALHAAQKGFLVAVPLLAGSLLRPLFGALADRIGGRRTGLLGLSLTLLPLLFGWQFASRFEHFLLIGWLLGVAGASFAVALPLASRWYPPEYQGLAMGVAGAGNSGTLLATLFMPRLATHFGWQNAFGLAMLPVLLVMVLFALMAKDSPVARKTIGCRDYASLLRTPDTGWFCLFYSVTFGGFVGLASFLTIYFVDQHGLAKVTAGDLATLAVLSGSFLRPIGGWLSDRIGGYRLLLALYCCAAAALAVMSASPALPVAVLLLVVVMALLGMGNGAVFQLVPLRFREAVGIVTGLVGAAGGFGGFLLPSMLGVMKQRTGAYSSGFLILAAVVFLAAMALMLLGPVWLRNWDRRVSARAGIFALTITTAPPQTAPSVPE